MVVSNLDVGIFNVVPFGSLIENLYLIVLLVSAGIGLDLRLQVVIELDHERSNILMLSTLFVIECFADDTLGQLILKNILELYVHSYDLLPHRIEGSLDSWRFYSLTLAVEPDEGVTIAFYVGWWEVFSFVEVEDKLIFAFISEALL